MLKNCLAMIGILFIAILAAVGVFLLVAFYDLSGTVPIPDITLRAPVVIGDEAGVTPEIEVSGGEATILERLNPLDLDPPALPTLTPEPTTVPPLDPEVYRAEVMVRLENFVTALERWMAANEALGQDSALLDDPAWRNEMVAILDSVSETAWALSQVDPPPPEYAAIDEWLKRLGPEADGLRESYLTALDTRDEAAFTTAADHFARIKEYLEAAVGEMLAANWPLN